MPLLLLLLEVLLVLVQSLANGNLCLLSAAFSAAFALHRCSSLLSGLLILLHHPSPND
jgi:hypothetical protein